MNTSSLVWIPKGDLSEAEQRVLAVAAPKSQVMDSCLMESLLTDKLEMLMEEAGDLLPQILEIVPD